MLHQNSTLLLVCGEEEQELEETRALWSSNLLFMYNAVHFLTVLRLFLLTLTNYGEWHVACDGASGGVGHLQLFRAGTLHPSLHLLAGQAPSFPEESLVQVVLVAPKGFIRGSSVTFSFVQRICTLRNGNLVLVNLFQ